MRKIIAFAAAAATVLALGLAGVPTAQGAPARSHSQSHHHDPGSYTPPPIQWGQCTSTTLQQFGAQCGFDHRRPLGSRPRR